MNVAAGPKLAAAVTNAGGMGVLGGIGYTPDMLREQIAELKANLNDKNAPFGVDLLLPQVGGNARKTKYALTAPDVFPSFLLTFPATITPRASSTSSSTSSSSPVPSSSSRPSVFPRATSLRSSTRPASCT
jgi:hypothetical protein